MFNVTIYSVYTKFDYNYNATVAYNASSNITGMRAQPKETREEKLRLRASNSLTSGVSSKSLTSLYCISSNFPDNAETSFTYVYKFIAGLTSGQ